MKTFLFQEDDSGNEQTEEFRDNSDQEIPISERPIFPSDDQPFIFPIEIGQQKSIGLFTYSLELYKILVLIL